MTPGIARNATFAASITVDCHSPVSETRWSGLKGEIVDLHKEQTPSIRKPTFA